MRAWQFSSTRGGIEKNLRLNTSAPVPAHDARALGRDKVLVKILAASINPVDYKVPELPIVGRLLYGKNATPGSDFAGVVAATATTTAPAATATREGDDEFREGQFVFGRLNQPAKHGTMEEYIVVERAKLVHVPKGVDPVDAAGVGVAGLTAYQCIQPFVQAGKGDRVFINGGSGGTGVWGIQIAKALGCRVTTSCSGANAELCKNLGADEVIDYRSTNVVEALKKSVSGDGQKFDLVVDNVGSPAELYWQSHHYLSEGARYVQIGVEPGLGSTLQVVMKLAWPGFLGGGKRKFDMLMVKNNTAQMAEIGNWMQQRKVKTVFDDGSALSIEDGAQAFAKLKTHRAKGKIVVKMTSE
jgi:NADPH:quinone reductase-like Zn-dependent oxidoreductase